MTATSFDVQGKVALVTGANRGIGRAIVESLINAGAEKVYAAVRNTDSARPLVEAHGSRIVPLRLNVTDATTIADAVKEAGDVDLVVNNAGVLKPAGPLDEAAIETLSFEIDVNVNGLLRMARAFAPILKTNGGGAFVQLNSVASMKAFPDFSTYCASKAAAYSITQSLREQLDAQNTLVASVHPGPIDTDMANDAGLGEMAETPPSAVADAIVAGLRAGQFHIYTDPMAEQIGGAYASFAEQVVETNLMEA